MGGLYDDRAWLYDAAFSWDVEEEVDWLLGRLGPSVRSVLEPGCGSGRLLAPFARRGVEVAGVDLSAAMLERARARFRVAHLAQPLLVHADMADFDLGRRFDGAVCPINTFGYLLRDEDAKRHLECVARHLGTGARYLVQLDLRSAPVSPGPTNTWEVDGLEGRIRCSSHATEFDAARPIETAVSRFEVIGGPHAGEVSEDRHVGRVWDGASWSHLVAASPFRQAAAFDGNAHGRPALPVGPGLVGQPLVWHELALG